jgi:hypothetical protein
MGAPYFVNVPKGALKPLPKVELMGKLRLCGQIFYIVGIGLTSHCKLVRAPIFLLCLT